MGNVDLTELEWMPDALHLVSNMLQSDPSRRISAIEVLHHPFFWSDAEKLAFLQDASDRIESDAEDTPLRRAVEGKACEIIGTSWEALLHPGLIENLGKYRKYDFSSMSSCLRVIRNKKHHYRDLPEDIQQLLGALPSGFLRYFLHRGRFPMLLMYTWIAFGIFCSHEEHLSKYYVGLTKHSRLRFEELVLCHHRLWWPSV